MSNFSFKGNLRNLWLDAEGRLLAYFSWFHVALWKEAPDNQNKVTTLEKCDPCPLQRNPQSSGVRNTNCPNVSIRDAGEVSFFTSRYYKLTQKIKKLVRQENCHKNATQIYFNATWTLGFCFFIRCILFVCLFFMLNSSFSCVCAFSFPP